VHVATNFNPNALKRDSTWKFRLRQNESGLMMTSVSSCSTSFIIPPYLSSQSLALRTSASPSHPRIPKGIFLAGLVCANNFSLSEALERIGFKPIFVGIQPAELAFFQ
jgi:hypothetical protein